MKILHLGDLHLGKRVNEISMIEDQKFILDQIVTLVKEEKIDVILLCGDIYDKAIPTIEAIHLLDEFLEELSDLKVKVLMISGNHDSSERLSFGRNLFKRSNLYIASQFNQEIEKITIKEDGYNINFYMLPFVKPANINHVLKIQTETYEECFKHLMEQVKINEDETNILLAHQFVTVGKNSPELSDSETSSLGGIDNIDYRLFDAFDYVALGHIHKPQAMGREMVRYAGSILKYSFSEIHHKKSVTIVEMKEKGNVEISTKELAPLRDWCEMKGTYMELTEKAYYENLDQDSYMHITLTDEEDIPEAVRKLQVIYPNLMKLDYDNQRTRGKAAFLEAAEAEEKTEE